MTLIQLFYKGGPVMFVLLAFSIVSVAIVLLKLFQFYRREIGKSDFVYEVLDALQADDIRMAMARLEQQRSPIAKVMAIAISEFRKSNLSAKDIQSKIERVCSRAVQDIETFLRALAAIAHLSPLLGLLGTVLGMITAFQKLEASGMKINPAILAGGIWEALLTTAFGLIIAIPTMAAYYYLEGEADKLRMRMKDALVPLFALYNNTSIQSTGDEEKKITARVS